MTEHTPQSEQITSFLTRYSAYLTELRGLLLTTIGVYIASLILGLFLGPKILVFLMSFFTLKGIHIVMSSPFQYLNLTLTTASVVAFMITLPYLMIRIFLFAKPALRKREMDTILSILPWSIFLLFAGFVCGMYITQVVITLYATTKIGFEVNNLWDIQRFFSQVLFTSFMMGLIFQIPLIMNACVRLNIVTKSSILVHRKHVYVGLLVVAALLPTTDAISLAVISGLLILLFEGSLLLNR